MKYYSDIPERRFRQLAGDIWLVIWTVGWIWVGVKLHGMIMNLAAPGQAISDGASGLARSIDSAAESIAGLPLIGGALAAPFSGISVAASTMASAGQAEADAVSNLAMFVSVTLVILAFASFAAYWLPIRLAFIHRASAAQRYVDSNYDLDLFALRALARQPLHVLARISDDPAGDWRRGDRRAIDRLAELELADEGLRMPPRSERRTPPREEPADDDTVVVAEIVDIDVVEVVEPRRDDR